MQDKNNIDPLGGVVKAARRIKQITQLELSERLGITVRYLKAIENSGRKPSYDLLVRMVHELDIPADSVFQIEQKKDESSVEVIQLWKAK